MVWENTVIGNKIRSIENTPVRQGDKQKVLWDGLGVMSGDAHPSQAAQGSLHAWNSPTLGSSQTLLCTSAGLGE